jgi:hypothetical protein
LQDLEALFLEGLFTCAILSLQCCVLMRFLLSLQIARFAKNKQVEALLLKGHVKFKGGDATW